MCLAAINIRLRRAVDENVEIERRKAIAQLLFVAEFELRMIESDNLKLIAICTQQRSAQAATRPDNNKS